MAMMRGLAASWRPSLRRARRWATPRPIASLRSAMLPAAMLLAVMLLAALPAAAQQACPGYLSATTLAPVPPEAMIGIALRNDDATGTALRGALYPALQRAGYRVGEPATHVLSWRGGLAEGGAGRGGGGRGITLGDLDNNRMGDDLGWMQDAPRFGQRGTPPVRRLNANVELRDRASGRVIWTAVISCDRQGQDQAALIATLVGAVVPVIGQTVGGRAF